jgi:hypothetical protein
MKKKPTKKQISSSKKNPIMIESEVSSKLTPTITIHVSGGFIEDVVKERCNNVEIVVHDYDIQGMDLDDKSIHTDDKGNQYKLIRF